MATIGILGAGALGRLWGARLPGDRVAFIPRDDEPSGAGVAYRFRPLHGAETTVRIPWLSQGDGPELVLVTIKAGDILDALGTHIHRIPETTPIVLFQNGLGSQQAVAARWPNRPILAASTTEGANRPEPDLLVHAGTGDTWVGALTEPAEDLLEPVVSQLRASGLTVHSEPDILPRLWQKLVINAGINPYTAILDCVNGEILSAPLFLDTVDTLCREVSELMAASGQEAPGPEILRERIEAVARRTASNTSSMRADVLRGRATEIDFINGYLARLGNELGISVSVNQMLTERVKQLSPH